MSPIPRAEGSPGRTAVREGRPRTVQPAQPLRDGGKTPGRSCTRRIVAALLAGLPALGAAFAAAEADPAPPLSPDARIAAARQTLRAMECARCHGKDYEGLAAPSIVEYARTQSREMFVRAVLDGDPARGMPGYRGNPRIAESIEDIFGYFLDRAMGADGRGP